MNVSRTISNMYVDYKIYNNWPVLAIRLFTFRHGVCGRPTLLHDVFTFKFFVSFHRALQGRMALALGKKTTLESRRRKKKGDASYLYKEKAREREKKETLCPPKEIESFR